MIHFLSDRPHLFGTALVLYGLLLAGCGGGNEVTYDPEQILQEIRASYAEAPDLTLEGTMKASAVPATINFDAWVKQYDSLRMTMTGPFGMAIGGLAATGDSFIFVSAFEGKVYSGTPDRRTMAKAARLSLDYRELVALMRAEVPRFPEKGALARGGVTSEQKSGTLHFSARRGDTVEQFAVDPKKLVILSYSQQIEREGKEPDILVEVAYDKFFMKVADRYFPEEAVMSVDNGAMVVRVTINRVRSGVPEGTKMTIDIPTSMEIERL